MLDEETVKIDQTIPVPFNDIQDKNFSDWVRNGRLTELASSAIDFGPRYHLASTKSRDIVIPVFSKGEVKSMTPHDPMGSNQNVYLMALDSETGRLVGYRKFLISPAGSQALAVGTIVVRDKDSGIATTLELTSHDYLQRLATQLGKPIMQAVTNFNQIELDRLEKAYKASQFRGNPDSNQLFSRLLAKRGEKDRWNALFGEKGKLGFDQDGFKTILPFNDRSTPIGSEDIFLERAVSFDVNGRELITPIQKVAKDTDPFSGNDRRKELEENILPQLHAILGN